MGAVREGRNGRVRPTQEDPRVHRGTALKEEKVSTALAITRLGSTGCAVRRRKWKGNCYEHT